MPKFKVVLLEHGYRTADPERNYVESHGGDFIYCDHNTDPQALNACLDADGVLVRTIKLTADRLEKYFRNVKVIVRYGIGVDNIDLDAATALNIIVSRIPDYGLEEVSDHAVALLLAGARGILERHKLVTEGSWESGLGKKIKRFCQCTVGLLAFGQIARCVARKLKSWNVRLIAYDPYIDPTIISDAEVEAVDFDTLLRHSAFLSIHAPLLPENYHLINASVLARMKPNTFIINTARGALIETAALAAALQAGSIAGAALDVFEQEPLPPDYPLRKAPNIIFTDHCAWYSENALDQLQISAAREVVRGATGQLPKTIANPDVLIRLNRQNEWPGDAASAWMARRKTLLGL